MRFLTLSKTGMIDIPSFHSICDHSIGKEEKNSSRETPSFFLPSLYLGNFYHLPATPHPTKEWYKYEWNYWRIKRKKWKIKAGN